MKTYRGVCYDGPPEGKQIVAGISRVPFMVRGDKKIEYWNGNPSPSIPVKHNEYRWSEAIRKWVYVW